MACFDEEIKTGCVSIPSYLGKLQLRTHEKDDTAPLASIFSNPLSPKYLYFLQPPNGWREDEQRRKEKI